MPADEKRQKEGETTSEQKRQELTRKANDVVITCLNERLRKEIPAKGVTDITRWKQRGHKVNSGEAAIVLSIWIVVKDTAYPTCSL